MEIETQLLGESDADKFIELINVFTNVFEMEHSSLPDRNYLAQLLQQDSFIVFAALSGGRVVGGLTAYVLPQYYNAALLIYLYDLAVVPEFQRQGVGRQLLAGLTSQCKELGAEELFVQADIADEHALDFYRSTGGRAADVVHFTYPMK